MKKLILLIVSFILAGLVLNGCSEKEDKDTQKLLNDLENYQDKSSNENAQNIMKGVSLIENGGDKKKAEATQKEMKELKPFMDVYGGDE